MSNHPIERLKSKKNNNKEEIAINSSNEKNDIKEDNKNNEIDKKKKIYQVFLDSINNEIEKENELTIEDKNEINRKLEFWDDKYIKISGEYEVFIKKIYLKLSKFIIKFQNENYEIAMKTYDLNNENQMYYLKKDIEFLLNKIGTQRENFQTPKEACAFLMNYVRENILKLKIKVINENDRINVNLL